MKEPRRCEYKWCQKPLSETNIGKHCYCHENGTGRSRKPKPGGMLLGGHWYPDPPEGNPVAIRNFNSF